MVVTEAPPIVSLRTMASPMPLVPPVTNIRLPFEFVSINGKRVVCRHYPISSDAILLPFSLKTNSTLIGLPGKFPVRRLVTMVFPSF
jgi:hypothetical protein